MTEQGPGSPACHLQCQGRSSLACRLRVGSKHAASLLNTKSPSRHYTPSLVTPRKASACWGRKSELAERPGRKKRQERAGQKHKSTDAMSLKRNAAYCPSPPSLPSAPFLPNAACSSCPFIVLLLHAGLSESQCYRAAKLLARPAQCQTGDALPPHHVPALLPRAGSQTRLGAQHGATTCYGQGLCWGLICAGRIQAAQSSVGSSAHQGVLRFL